jgi:uncharacterized protein (TIGR02246 family)
MTPNRKRMILIGLIAVTMAACTPGRVDLAAEAAAIRATDQAWLDAAEARDVTRIVSYWSEDAVLMPPGRPPLVGRDAIREFVQEALATPGFSIRWQPGEPQVAASGDMAFSTGTNEVRYTDADGNEVVERNKGVVIWRKQADGSWKCAVDIWNAAGE